MTFSVVPTFTVVTKSSKQTHNKSQ